MRTENFEITPAEEDGHLIDTPGLGSEFMWVDGKDLQELYDLLGHYLGNFQRGGKLDLDLREDKK
jgi:putative ribosome biogenesis GTPase RsgA